MKRFVWKLIIVLLLFVATEIIVLCAVPKDKSSSLYEYNHKIELLEKTPSPRIVIIGGSSVAFGTDSKRIKDSLAINVINFGLHAGIGVRYVLEDYLMYVRKGDLVLLQIEYANFYNGGNGSGSVWCQFMIATDWRRAGDLNFDQWYNLVLDAPSEVVGNINRLLKYPIRKSWNSPSSGSSFRNSKEGYNEFGDEVDHWKYPSPGIKPRGIVEEREIDQDFMIWFKGILEQYEQKGARVMMVPPVNVTTNFKETWNPNVDTALKSINRPYVVDVGYMVLDDSCSFDGGYHVNKEGVRQNTDHLIEILRKKI